MIMGTRIRGVLGSARNYLKGRLRSTKDPLRGQPWLPMPNVRQRFAEVPTMLSGEEIKLLYWLARDYYSGTGSIVDLGPFLGGSTSALCAGLKDNPRVVRKEQRVHSYDRFIHEPYFNGYMALLGKKLNDRDSFLAFYEQLIAQYRDLVTLHVGDIVNATYTDRDIEVFFLDICKSWEINARVVRQFYGRLIPGRTVVVHQDYIHYWHYWLHVTMDFFREYFEYVGRVAEGHSEVFLNTKPIPERLLDVDLRALSKHDKQAAFERVLMRFPEVGWQRAEIVLAYAHMLLLDHRDLEGARRIFDRVSPSLYEHPISVHGITCYRWHEHAVEAGPPPGV